MPAAPGVEQPAEDRWRIETGQAHPDESAVPADEGGGGAVADEP